MNKIRQLHTVISRETIKPSSQTPPHFKTHKLSLIDHFAPNIHMPWVFFYPTYKNGDINILKKSLSQCLTQYYPFAGRFLEEPCAPHIDCNDQGVEFLEASIDTRLDDFIFKKEQDETLDQLIPNGLGCTIDKTSLNMVEVQLNRFTCGGVAVAVSISHKIADAFTMVNFCNHWATVACGGSPINPSFFSSSASNTRIPKYPLKETGKIEYATRTFVFPNSKLNELKTKVNVMGTTPRVDPTRVESLTSLLFKCAVGASTINSGSFQPSNLCQSVNLRNKISTKFHKLAAGNLSIMVFAKIVDSRRLELNQVITSLRKEMMELQGVKNVDDVGGNLVNTVLTLGNDQSRTYNFSSLCRFPFYQVDFGWGNPVRVMLRTGNPGNFLILMDTPTGDGIEAMVQLEKEEMTIFQNDKKLLAYVENI